MTLDQALAENVEAVQDDGMIAPAASFEAELSPAILGALKALVGTFRSETEAVVAAKAREIEQAQEEKSLLEQDVAMLRDKIGEQRVELADLVTQLEAERADRQAIEAAAAAFAATLESIRTKRPASTPVDDRKAMPAKAKRTRKEKCSDARGTSHGCVSSGEESANVVPEREHGEAATETDMAEDNDDTPEEVIEITLRVPARIVEEIDREVAGGRHRSREEGLRALIVDRWQRRDGMGRRTDAGRLISVPAPCNGAGAAEPERMKPPPAR